MAASAPSNASTLRTRFARAATAPAKKKTPKRKAVRIAKTIRKEIEPRPILTNVRQNQGSSDSELSPILGDTLSSHQTSLDITRRSNGNNDTIDVDKTINGKLARNQQYLDFVQSFPAVQSAPVPGVANQIIAFGEL